MNIKLNTAAHKAINSGVLIEETDNCVVWSFDMSVKRPSFYMGWSDSAPGIVELTLIKDDSTVHWEKVAFFQLRPTITFTTPWVDPVVFAEVSRYTLTVCIYNREALENGKTFIVTLDDDTEGVGQVKE